MQITWQHLAGNFLRAQPQFFANILFNAWVNFSKRSHGPRDLTGFNASGRVFEALIVAFHFRVPAGNFEAKSRWLSVNPVRPPHADRVLVFIGHLFQDFHKVLDVLTQNLVDLLKLVALSRINDVSTGQTIVYPLAFWAQRLGNITRKGDHVMVRDGFDFLNAFHGEFGVLLNFFNVFGRNLAQLAPGFISRDFYGQPTLIAGFIAPQLLHFWTGITINH